MSVQTLNLTPQLYQYLLDETLRELPVQKQLRQVTAKRPGGVMQISPEQGQFMGLLVKLMGARRTLDIGTFTGYSALSVALALPPGGQVVTLDIDKDSTRTAQEFWLQAGVAHQIDLRLAPALETLNDLLANREAGAFDFAFIDADKSTYPKYYEACLKLIRVGGLIAIDNALWDGKVADLSIRDKQTTCIRDLNQLIRDDDRVDMSLLPIGDGLLLARKRR